VWRRVHGQGPRKISRSKQYRRGTPPPPCRPLLSRMMSSAWRIVPFNLEESFHWPASHLHLLFYWLVDSCQGVPVSEISLTYTPQLYPQALQQTSVVQTHNVDHYPTMWERLTMPFHRTNWVCGPTPVKEHSAAVRVSTVSRLRSLQRFRSLPPPPPLPSPPRPSASHGRAKCLSSAVLQLVCPRAGVV